MKNLFLIFVLLITTSLFAQENSADEGMVSVDQSRGWMSKIAADSEMRSQMMDMMILETQGSSEEMMKLVDLMLRNPEMNKMISEKSTMKSEKTDYDLKPRGMDNDKTKIQPMKTTSPTSKKRL